MALLLLCLFWLHRRNRKRRTFYVEQKISAERTTTRDDDEDTIASSRPQSSISNFVSEVQGTKYIQRLKKVVSNEELCPRDLHST